MITRCRLLGGVGLFALMLALAAPARAQGVNLSAVMGNVLAQECAGDESKAAADFCNGYILGAADQLQVIGKTCRPASDTAIQQTIAIARRYLREHPEEWPKHGFFLVQTALMQAYPCPAAR